MRKVLLFALALFGSGFSFAQDGLVTLSPEEIIETLTNFDNVAPDDPMRNLVSCQAYASLEKRTLARQLVGAGTRAVPTLDYTLHSLEELGRESPYAKNANWLLFAWAKLTGNDGAGRLRGMLSNVRLGFLDKTVELALSSSFDLTSYVRRSKALSRLAFCDPADPRDVLDQLIRAWLRDEDQQILASFSEAGKRFWHERTGARVGESSREGAIGYRFEDVPFSSSGTRWALPREALNHPLPTSLPKGDIVLKTEFTTASGKVCGEVPVRFLRVNGPDGFLSGYVIDNPESFMMLFVTCVSP